jgi:AraC-like DNA-binding protein
MSRRAPGHGCPYFVQGVHVASLSSGQILADPPSERRFDRLKRRLSGLSLSDRTLARAYREAPYIPMKTVRHIMTLLEIFAVQLCEDLRKIRGLQSQLERDDVRRAKAHVAAHFADAELDLAATAAHAGLSPTHFSRVFKKSTGVPLHALRPERPDERREKAASAQREVGFRNLLRLRLQQHGPVHSGVSRPRTDDARKIQKTSSAVPKTRYPIFCGLNRPRASR